MTTNMIQRLLSNAPALRHATHTVTVESLMHMARALNKPILIIATDEYSVFLNEYLVTPDGSIWRGVNYAEVHEHAIESSKALYYGIYTIETIERLGYVWLS